MQTSIYNSFVYFSIQKNGLLSIEPILKRERKNVFQPSSLSAVFSCLQWFSDDELQADYIFIDNPDLKPQLIQISYVKPLMCVVYDEQGWFITIIPFGYYNTKLNNQRIFTYRYILFARYEVLEEKMEEQPKLTFKRWGRKI